METVLLAEAELHARRTARAVANAYGQAVRMHTDRRQLDRLLDPENSSVTLRTLRRAATAVGRTLRIELA